MSVKFSKEHEWVSVAGDIATIGITNHAQEQLGDVVFVELPAVGKKVAKGGDAAVVESVKAASEVYAPVTGEVVDLMCNIDHNATGDKHSACGNKCIKGGGPVGIVVASTDEPAARELIIHRGVEAEGALETGNAAGNTGSQPALGGRGPIASAGCGMRRRERSPSKFTSRWDKSRVPLPILPPQALPAERGRASSRSAASRRTGR